MPPQPWFVYPFVMLLGIVFGIVIVTVVFKWVGVDFSPQSSPALVGQPTLAPTTTHAAPVETQSSTPITEQTRDVVKEAPNEAPNEVVVEGPQSQSSRPGFTSAVRYEVLLPYDSDNQFYREALREHHIDGDELTTEFLRQLDILDLQTQSHYGGIFLNSEGDYREGRYHKFIFDDSGSQDDDILAMMRMLRRSSPIGFIHVRAYEVSYRDY